jgi:hypothetical protein
MMKEFLIKVIIFLGILGMGAVVGELLMGKWWKNMI